MEGDLTGKAMGIGEGANTTEAGMTFGIAPKGSSESNEGQMKSLKSSSQAAMQGETMGAQSSIEKSVIA